MLGKKSPVKADYRITKAKPSGKLDPLPASKSLPPAKLKPFLRYSGDQKTTDTKAVLLNTVIEEHLLKFGLIGTFDIFIKEVAEKALKMAISGAKVVPIKEIQDKAIEVFLYKSEFQKRKWQGLFCKLAETDHSKETGKPGMGTRRRNWV